MRALEDRIAIVTGAAGGIGKAIAERFLVDGARVVIADIDDGRGKATALELGVPDAIRFVRTDVGSKSEVDALVSATIETFGGVDILVNNAGIAVGGAFLDLPEEDFDRVLRVNLKGSFLVAQAVARVMVERIGRGGRPGAIVNMSSVNAVLAIPEQLPYAVSKGGVAQLTRAMALALAPHGIRVNAIGPGSIQTDMLTSVNNSPEAMKRLLSRTPLGRIGEASEIAAIASFLVSDDASYVTGQTIYADGGRMPLNYTVAVRD